MKNAKKPLEVIAIIPGEPGDFGDGSTYIQQPVVAPGKGAAKNSGKELRRASSMGGFGVGDDQDPLRK